MKKQYECLIIIDDSLNDEDKKKTGDKVKQIFSKFKATVLKKKEWGRKKLGYPIKKSKFGVFFIFYLEIESSKVAELRVLLGYEAGILKNILFLVENWEKEFEYFQELIKNPNLNIEKINPENKS